MKKLMLLLISACLVQISLAQVVSLDSIAKYEGKSITVCSKVMGIYVSKNEKKVTYINFGNPYPDNTFTAVIFEKDLPNFKYNPAEYLKDKNVCITGIVKIYRGKPEIIITDEEQLKIK
jgi:hypothetical protein